MAALQVGVVPGHLVNHGLRHLKAGGAAGQLGDAIAHLGHLRKHHRGTGTHQQICAKSNRGVGGDARESVAAATLHSHHQLAGRYGLTTTGVQPLQVRHGARHDGVKHGHEAHMLSILQAQHIQRALVYGIDCNAAGGKQAIGLQLLAAQANDHHLAAKVGVAADVVQGPDGDDGVRRVYGHAATIAVLEPHHAVHMGVARQQFVTDAFDGQRHYAGHALNRGGDSQQVAGAHRAVGIAVALKGVPSQCRQVWRGCRGHGQGV